jgi:hypothetical protein
MRVSHSSVLVGLAVVAVAVTATGLTYAATTPRTAYVYACANHWHTLHIMRPGGRCEPGFTKVAINQRGPRGPRGARGPGAQPLTIHSTEGNTTRAGNLIGHTGLRATTACSPGGAARLYILDTDGSADFEVSGPAQFSGTSGGQNLMLYYDGRTARTVPLNHGANLVDLPQRANKNANAEFQIADGSLATSVLVTRRTETFTINMYLHVDSEHCGVQAQITPTV